MVVIREMDYWEGRIIYQVGDNLPSFIAQISRIVNALSQSDGHIIMTRTLALPAHIQFLIGLEQGLPMEILLSQHGAVATVIRSDTFNYHTTVIYTITKDE